MNGSLSTVKVQNDDAPEGFAIINLSDLTDDHVLHDEVAEVVRREPVKDEKEPTKVVLKIDDKSAATTVPKVEDKSASAPAK